MCFPATADQAQAFAGEIAQRLPDEVKRATVERTGRENPWFPGTDVEVVVVARSNPEELRPRVAELVSDFMWRQDVWVEVRIVEADAIEVRPRTSVTLVDA